MATAFTQNEKQRINDALLDAGEQRFIAQGLKKTSLDDLVAAVGIAKGSFYAFFDSKESLYLAVMLKRAPSVAARIAATLESPVSEDGLVKVLRSVTDALADDPMYRRLITRPEELDAVTDRLGNDQIARVTPHLVTPLLDYLTTGQREGALVDDIEPAVLLQVIRAIGLVVVHRDRFEPGYDAVLDATIRTLARGMRR
ncbi:TetR/AcrR family transcriptional regulator [Mycobacterium sp. NPDC004974]